MLQLQNWSKSFDNQVIFDNLSLKVATGNVLTIIGESGSGKSTLLRSINFLTPADHGIIQIGTSSLDVKSANSKDILNFRRKTAMVFQNYGLFSKKTVLENVMENLLVVQKLSTQIAKERASHYLNQVGMQDFFHVYPNRLSGGQQQRVGIARAMAIEPEVMLLDEPTSALDPERVNGIFDLIQSIAHQEITMLLVTHEMEFARHVSDQMIFLNQGKILEQGSPDQLFNHAKEARTRQFIQGFRRFDC